MEHNTYKLYMNVIGEPRILVRVDGEISYFEMWDNEKEKWQLHSLETNVPEQMLSAGIWELIEEL